MSVFKGNDAGDAIDLPFTLEKIVKIVYQAKRAYISS